jgi:hypothetical protein
MRLHHLLRAVALPAALVLTLLGSTVAAAAEPAPATTGTAVVSGTGRLAAAGAGVVRVRGSFTITGAMNGGSLLVDGIDRTTAIRVTGWTSKTRVDGDSLLYRGVKGTFTVAGRTIRVTISSPQVRFVAYGTGAAHLRGVGVYRVNGGPSIRWPRAGAWIAL